VVHLIADACLVRNIQFTHERGEVETADVMLQLVLPSDVRRKSEDRVREICEAVGSPALKDMDPVALPAPERRQ
jgi:hypothetical protein